MKKKHETFTIYNVMCKFEEIFFLYFFRALQHVQDVAKGQSIYDCYEPRCNLDSVFFKKRKERYILTVLWVFSRLLPVTQSISGPIQHLRFQYNQFIL